jgi:serine/threonine protein phosphatase PrpC
MVHSKSDAKPDPKPRSKSDPKPHSSVESGPWQGVESASRSDVGRVRETNQDACGSFDDRRGDRLFVVADGMGGHRGGDVASSMAVEAIATACAASEEPPAERLRTAVAAANRAIFERSEREPELGGMGTTVVALLLAQEGGAWVAHVGDSRLYRLRAGRLETLTADHSLVAELQRQGYLDEAEAARHPRRHELLRSVGCVPEVEAEIGEIAFEPGDRLLLCTDGLCGYVDPHSIANALAEASPELAARTLVDLANAGGGEDNVTVQVVERTA